MVQRFADHSQDEIQIEMVSLKTGLVVVGADRVGSFASVAVDSPAALLRLGPFAEEETLPALASDWVAAACFQMYPVVAAELVVLELAPVAAAYYQMGLAQLEVLDLAAAFVACYQMDLVVAFVELEEVEPMPAADFQSFQTDPAVVLEGVERMPAAGFQSFRTDPVVALEGLELMLAAG